MLVHNVLLMLSSAQPPPPLDEVASLAGRATDGEAVALVTTQTIRHLTPAQSVVAVYGDASLDNAFLGCGLFDSVVALDSPEGRAMARDDQLYGRSGVPTGAKAFVLLRQFRQATSGETLATLGGVIAATGLPLTLANLPKGQARTKVYYTTSVGVVGITSGRSD